MSRYTTRPALPADLDFIRALHEASMRPHVERQFGFWDEAFQARKFDEAVPKKDHRIIEVDNQSVGLLHILYSPSEIHLDQIWLLPAHQNSGIGSAILERLVAESRQQAVPITLSVLQQNPAVHLYTRFGFIVTGGSDTHHVMCRPHDRG